MKTYNENQFTAYEFMADLEQADYNRDYFDKYFNQWDFLPEELVSLSYRSKSKILRRNKIYFATIPKYMVKSYIDENCEIRKNLTSRQLDSLARIIRRYAYEIIKIYSETNCETEYRYIKIKPRVF